LVGLASNFITGIEEIPLDAEKHMETPLMEGIDHWIPETKSLNNCGAAMVCVI